MWRRLEKVWAARGVALAMAKDLLPSLPLVFLSLTGGANNGTNEEPSKPADSTNRSRTMPERESCNQQRMTPAFLANQG